jgi:hypothetical protein
MENVNEKVISEPQETPACIYSKEIPPRHHQFIPRPSLALLICRRRVLIGGESQTPGK